MNDDDLDRLLQGARAPDLPDDYWGRLPDRILRRLSETREDQFRSRFWRLNIALAAAAACGLALSAVLWHRNAQLRDAYAALRDGRVLRELEARYPGRLKAIIQDGSGLHTQLSDVADVSASDPIWLEIRDGKDDRVIVTFSGQQIRCGGRNVIVVSGLDGQIMLIGDEFFWSRQASAGLAERLKIRGEHVPRLRAPAKPASPL
jgi:hypothetical protein